MRQLSRRVARLRARLDPAPTPPFLAFARAVIAWGGSAPHEESVRDLARALQQTGRGATWTALVALADEEPLAVPVIDPARLTPAEREEAGRLRAIVEAGGLAALSDGDLALAECLRSKVDGLEDGACLVELVARG